jgi:hypothetical protein
MGHIDLAGMELIASHIAENNAAEVKKLKAARDRKSFLGGRRIEGRRSYRELNPELVRIAKRLDHGNRKERLSLRAISARLKALGYITSKGTSFSAAQVKRLLAA